MAQSSARLRSPLFAPSAETRVAGRGGSTLHTAESSRTNIFLGSTTPNTKFDSQLTLSRSHFILWAVILLTGCATTARPQPVTDVKLIVGAWRGSNNTGSPVDLIIHENGRFDAIITTPQQTLRRSGQIRMEGQQLSYDADSSYGQFAYFEGDGKRRLIMWGTLKEGGQKFVIEFLPSNR